MIINQIIMYKIIQVIILINKEQAREITRGEETIAAVVDTGVDYLQEDKFL